MIFKTLNIKTVILVAVIAFCAGSFGAWWLTAEYKDNKWEALIATTNQWAAEALQTATERTRRIERENEKLATSLEVKHVESEQLLDQILADNQRLARQLDGLRDPGNRQNCRDPMPTDGTAATEPIDRAGGARLSEHATGFLLAFARDADNSAQYAKTCYQWIQRLMTEQEKADRQKLLR